MGYLKCKSVYEFKSVYKFTSVYIFKSVYAGKAKVMKRSKVVMLVLMLTAGAVLSLATDADEKEEKKEKEVKSGKVEKRVTAKVLVSAYDNNEVRADQEYKGRIVEVSGKVGSVGKDVLEKAYVTLKGGNLMREVQCFVTKAQENKLAGLEKGQSIKIKGKVEGLMMNVVIRGCLINP